MGYFREKNDGEFDFDKLQEGTYFFTGLEGYVKVEVDKNGKKSWDLDNWFASLDPDKDEDQRNKIIQDIKLRLNADTGTINPSRNQSKISFFNPFKTK
tara:strand:+ start:111 stop:404 length:294 start_codon:yes stop_codon:yes gene_type:complete